MGDWRDLPPGLDLDRVLAERLGWKAITETESYEENRDNAGFRRRLSGYNPRNGLANPDEFPELIPLWSLDATSAIRDLWDADVRWSVYPSWPGEDKKAFTATYPAGGDQGAGEIDGDTAAHAIVRAKIDCLEWIERYCK